MAHLGRPERAMRCPICGVGVLATISFDDAPSEATPFQQRPESRQVDRYTCGHEVPGDELEVADEGLDVERRRSDETAAPLPGGEAEEGQG
jgi:hypothetical protein